MSTSRLVFLASFSFLLANAARVMSYVGDSGSHMSHHVAPTVLSALPTVGLQGRLAPKPHVGARTARRTNGVMKAQRSGAVGGSVLPRHRLQAMAMSGGDAFTRHIVKQRVERAAHQILFEQAMLSHIIQNAEPKPPFTKRAQVGDSFTRRIVEHQANPKTSGVLFNGSIAVEHQLSEADQKRFEEHAKWFSREFAEFQTKHKDSREKRAVLNRLIKLYFSKRSLEPDFFTRYIAQYQADLRRSRGGVDAAFNAATENAIEEKESAEDTNGFNLSGSWADRLGEREEYRAMLKNMIKAENDLKTVGPFSIPAPGKIGPPGSAQETVLEVEKVMLDWWSSADKQAQELLEHGTDNQYRLMQNTKLELSRMSADIAADTSDHIFALALGGTSVEHIQAIATVRLEQVRDFDERFRDLARARGLSSWQHSGEYIEMVRIDSLAASPHATNKGLGRQLLNAITNWAEHEGKLATVYPHNEEIVDFFTSQGFKRNNLSWRLVSSSNGESKPTQGLLLDLVWQPNTDARHEIEKLASLAQWHIPWSDLDVL